MSLHHKLCHTLGGSFNIPHAETHTIVLLHALEYNVPMIPGVIKELADVLLGSERDATQGLNLLLIKLRMKRALKDFGLKYDDVVKAAELAVANFWFNAIVPVPYPIPHDGPVGKLLGYLGHHPYRPSHIHFKFEKEGYDPLITALYLRNDPYENSDAVFGVKDSLVVDVKAVDDSAVAEKYGVEVGCALIEYAFVLMLESEALEQKERRATEAIRAQGMRVTFLDGLPVTEVD